MRFLWLALVITVLLGCSEDKKPAIVSERFESLEFESGSFPKFIALIQLKSPALLEQLIVEEGVQVIDEKLLEKINNEHNQVINDLRSISPDIQVLYSYKRVFNGMAIVAPIESASQIEKLASLRSYEADESFARPTVKETKVVPNLFKNISTKNSVDYINAIKVHKELGITGKGVKVGVIDTGIDYTHLMLGGTGSVEDFKSVDPKQKSKFFPNQKVVGGKDFVGSEFSVSSIYFSKFIPKPDLNPIDITGHGTHVAGSVGGTGDGVNTYSGVAPEAELYALKVFGDVSGSTSDSVVLASFEYAADPNGDFNIEDKLDVINLSLGSGYGLPHEFYNYAVTNLVESGTVVVASAGNSGDIPYITGSPGTSTNSLSVAAGIDHMEHNWKASAVDFFTEGKLLNSVRAFESSFSVKIADLTKGLQGKLVDTKSTAKEEFSAEVLQLVKGNIAVIDRGGVSFSDKFKRAQLAGALGVIIVNNVDGEPIPMGGGDDKFKFTIPGIMVPKAVGQSIRSAMAKSKVDVNFSTGKLIEFPEVIGTITGFSSKGPRSLDSLLKPEITGPGSQILSAAVGKGDKGVTMSGTSMSAPHLAGVMALLKEKHKKLKANDLKSMVMNSSIEMKDKDGVVYPLSRQGSGMVDTYKAVTSKISTHPAAVSLGEHSLFSDKNINYKLNLKNVSSAPITVDLSYAGDSNIVLNGDYAGVTLLPMNSTEVKLSFSILVVDEPVFEMNGFVDVKTAAGEVLASVPVMAVIDQASNIKADSFSYELGSINNIQFTKLTLKNDSRFAGEVYPFNLLSKDERKRKATETRTSTCDLEAVGFRYTTGTNDIKNILELGIKLYNPLTNWQHCLVRVEFDTDIDGQADFMLIAGRNDRNSIGSSSTDYVSYLLNNKIREQLIAENLKQNLSSSKTIGISLDLQKAVVSALEMVPMNHSTLSIVKVDSSLVGVSGKPTAVRVSIANVQGLDVEESDTLVGGSKAWHLLNISGKEQGFMDLPNKIEVGSRGSVVSKIKMTEGELYNPLVLFTPTNKFTFSHRKIDSQMELVKPF